MAMDPTNSYTFGGMMDEGGYQGGYVEGSAVGSVLGGDEVSTYFRFISVALVIHQ